ncbi:IF2P factor, partial [Polypterus senegalus]
MGRVKGSNGFGASVAEERFTDLDFVCRVNGGSDRGCQRLSKESECLRFRVSWIKNKIQAFNDLLAIAISSVSDCGESVDLVERFTYLGSNIHVYGYSFYEKSESKEEDIDLPPVKSEKKKTRKGKKQSSEADEEAEQFDNGMENNTEKAKKMAKQTPAVPAVSQDISEDEDEIKSTKKGTGNKKNRKKDASDSEDEDQSVKGVQKTADIRDSPGESDEDTDSFSKKGKKGQKKNQKPKAGGSTTKVESDGEDEDDVGSFKIKTAAQKKAEKKERERKKKEEEKAKLKKLKEQETNEPTKKEDVKKAEQAAPKAEPKSVQPAVSEDKEGAEDAGGEDDNDGEKKKKDKKKKKGEKEEKEKKKGPSKATVKAMQEALARMKEEEERAKREEEERLRRLEEQEAQRLEQERLEQERKERKKQKEKERKERLKKEGKLLTKSQKEARARAEATLKFRLAQDEEVKTIKPEADIDDWEAMASDEEKAKDKSIDGKDQKQLAISAAKKEKISSKDFSSSSETESDSDDGRTKEEQLYDRAKRRIEKRRAENFKNINQDKLRAPVICVLGHVDTGKTKILDKLRHTHVQDSEAGGITQQIGATNVPLETVIEQTKMVKSFDRENIKIPGMLIIDTPGHESFSNLRNRGSSLCDIAILVVDIMHGLEPQTIESINLLKEKKCPFIVALNKIDRLYDWKKSSETDVVATLKKQKKNTKDEFDERAKAIIVEFAQQGLNAALFYENKDPRTFLSLVPTSAHTGDGMGNLIALLVELTQTMLSKRLAHSDELRAQVMEVKALPGMGTTIDVILINGCLKEGETIIVPGVEGPIVTQIRGLLLPPPLKELRVKNQYEKHKEVSTAQGVKILGKDLEKTLAGLPLLVAYKEDEIPVLKDELIRELKQTLSSIKLEEKGVYVQASTLGSLEALLEFLRTSKVPGGQRWRQEHENAIFDTLILSFDQGRRGCIVAGQSVHDHVKNSALSSSVTC